jgi:EAL domain-containing protein (putative c-di-GMP-specific phosphodiesterase class I)/FixJ family two-component response regulator
MGALQQPEPPQTALVLDDEVQIGTFVCKALTSFGLAAKHFTEPLEFLLEVKRAPPDILILDLALGRSDAVDVIRKLEFLKFAGRVILISGHDQATLREFERVGRAHGLRMLPSLHKPFRTAEFRALIQSAAEPDCVSDHKQSGRESNAIKPGRLLEEALANAWLEVWYQPKIDLRSLTVCGAEALIRARHPEFGVIEPANLLPPAGDPLYKPLTQFVVKQAMLDWLKFAERGHLLKLSINVPASVLSAAGFVDFIRNARPAHPKFPGLIVEVTEDEVIRDIGWIHEVATQLRLYNVWISVDDFGSAYASLSRIRDLPVREIKLDRCFVAGCATDNLKRGLCQTVSDLAHCFGASACAEGVETVEDLRCLVDLGFDAGQGIVFARPMQQQHFVDFVATQQHADASRGNAAGADRAVRAAQT